MKRPTGTLLVLAALLVSTAGAQPRRFTIAIVRLDDRLVPFASYDGEHWEKAWPEPGEAILGKRTIDELPSVWRRRGQRVPEIWQVWRTGRATPIEARVTGAEGVEAHCESQIALRTDLPEAKRKRPGGAPMVEGRAGVAVDSSNVPVAAIEALRPSGATWRAAERAVLPRFSTLEAGRAQAQGVRLPVETPAPVARMTALYRQVRAPRSPMYFVADKEYRPCTARTIMTGWLLPADAGGWTLRNPRVWLTDCDLTEGRIALPLAALRVSSQLFWVLQEHGYEDETYVIAEVGPSEVRYPIAVNGGGC